MARIARSSMFPASGGTRRTTSTVNLYSTAGYTPINQFGGTDGTVATLSGALTAATLKTMLDITSVGGRVSQLHIRANDATARTLRVKITLDAVVIVDVTSASYSISGTGACYAGASGGTNSIRVPELVFTTSLKIEIASSLSETDKFTMFWIYNTES